MKKIILSLSLATIFSFSSCSFLSDMLNPQSMSEQESASQENISQSDDVVRPDLIWDTETLFATKPELRETDVSLGETP